MAKEQGITGWHAMRKDQLIRALSLPRPAAVTGKDKAGSRPNGPPARKDAADRAVVLAPNGRGNGHAGRRGPRTATAVPAADASIMPARRTGSSS